MLQTIVLCVGKYFSCIDMLETSWAKCIRDKKDWTAVSMSLARIMKHDRAKTAAKAAQRIERAALKKKKAEAQRRKRSPSKKNKRKAVTDSRSGSEGDADSDFEQSESDSDSKGDSSKGDADSDFEQSESDPESKVDSSKLCCKYCNLSFRSTRGLNQHIKLKQKDGSHTDNHPAVLPHKCQYCKKEFDTSANLERHVSAFAYRHDGVHPSNSEQSSSQSGSEVSASDCDHYVPAPEDMGSGAARVNKDNIILARSRSGKTKGGRGAPLGSGLGEFSTVNITKGSRKRTRRKGK
jgi:hypothetical protein